MNGKPVLEQIYLRIKASPKIEEVWFVTSENRADDPIAELAKKLNIHCFRGHAEDVLDRIYHASLETQTDLILEVGGDCPLVDPYLIEIGMKEYQKYQSDFTSNAFFPPYTFPVGYDFCLIKKTALSKLHEAAKLKSERLQPFQYIVRHPELFSTTHFKMEKNLNHWRWTLDYPEDLEFFRKLFSRLQVERAVFDFPLIETYLNTHPDLIEINSQYAEPIGLSTAWHTGSYVAEMQIDITNFLKEAEKNEKEKKWDEAISKYSAALGLIQELVRRSEYFKTQSGKQS